jgi:predicted metal-dependent phosphoesterase TrpH
VIDLHLHTTASDGRLAPAELVERVVAVGITTMSVTDHDTVVGLPPVRRIAEEHGIELIDGIEITAVHDGRDVHMLGYFFDPSDQSLADFLVQQRANRIDRVREIAARLAALGVPVSVDKLLARAAQRPGASVGRPVIARALWKAGRVASMQEAFDRFLAAGQPAFVPRRGSSPEEVIQVIHRAGGLASMAHPGVTKQPALLTALAEKGLDAVEVYHSDHSPEVRQELAAFTAAHNLLVTGGSDFHGDEDSRDRPLGGTTLPSFEFDRLRAAVQKAPASGS